MSQEFPATITCPKCGEKIKITVWKSLNRQIDPEVADRLMAGGFFHIKCPKCGLEAPVCYRMLYHDMNHKTMIQFTPPAEGEDPLDVANREAEQHLKEILTMKENMPEDLFDMVGHEVFRVVTSHVALMEKARLLRADLDDRVVELMKVLIRRSGKISYPEMKIEVLCFDDVEEKEPSFVLIAQGDMKMRLPFLREVYDDLQQRCQKLIPDFSNNAEVLVDEAWAEKVFDTLGMEKKSC